MRDVRDFVGLLQATIGRGQRRLDSSRFVPRCALALLLWERILFQVFEQLSIRRLRVGLPFRAYRSSGASRNCRAWRSHADKIAIANNRDARDLFRFLRV